MVAKKIRIYGGKLHPLPPEGVLKFRVFREAPEIKGIPSLLTIGAKQKVRYGLSQSAGAKDGK